MQMSFGAICYNTIQYNSKYLNCQNSLNTETEILTTAHEWLGKNLDKYMTLV